MHFIIIVVLALFHLYLGWLKEQYLGKNSLSHICWSHFASPAELHEKRVAILTLIQEEGESFAQPVEMYNERRMELVKMLEDFYISFRSLAESYDQLKSELMQSARSGSSASSNSMKPLLDLQSANKRGKGKYDDSKLEQPNSNPESVVEDPDIEFSNKTMDGVILVKTDDHHLNLNKIQIQDFEELNDGNDEKISGYDAGNGKFSNFEMTSFSDENMMWIQISELLQENLRQQAELIKRNEEKRETIRDLCLRLHRVMEENKALQQKCRGCYKIVNKHNPSSQMSRWKGMLLGKLWAGGST